MRTMKLYPLAFLMLPLYLHAADSPEMQAIESYRDCIRSNVPPLKGTTGNTKAIVEAASRACTVPATGGHGAVIRMVAIDAITWELQAARGVPVGSTQ